MDKNLPCPALPAINEKKRDLTCTQINLPARIENQWKEILHVQKFACQDRIEKGVGGYLLGLNPFLSLLLLKNWIEFMWGLPSPPSTAPTQQHIPDHTQTNKQNSDQTRPDNSYHTRPGKTKLIPDQTLIQTWSSSKTRLRLIQRRAGSHGRRRRPRFRHGLEINIAGWIQRSCFCFSSLPALQKSSTTSLHCQLSRKKSIMWVLCILHIKLLCQKSTMFISLWEGYYYLGKNIVHYQTMCILYIHIYIFVRLFNLKFSYQTICILYIYLLCCSI